MQNIAVQIDNIEKSLQALAHRIGGDMPDFIATALYMKSSTPDNSVFAIAHAGGDDRHQHRADQRIWHRRLSPALSTAAQVFDADKPVLLQSTMLPDQHLCAHFPIYGKKSVYGSLQTVFTLQSDINIHSTALRDMHRKAEHKLAKPLAQIMKSAHDIDELLNIRPPYAADSVIMFCDISGLRKASGHNHYRAQDFADQFCRHFIHNITRPYNAQDIRFEGDGIWLSFPFTPDDDAARAHVIHQARNAARAIEKGYESFAARTDRNFKNTKIKILMELGELRDLSWPSGHMVDRSGPAFMPMRQALDHMARQKNHVMIGPEMAACIPAEHIRPASRKTDFSTLVL